LGSTPDTGLGWFFVVVVGSFLSLWLWVAIYSAFPGSTFTGTAARLFSTFNFFGTVALVQVIAIAPRLITMYILTTYFPIDADIIRERVVFRKSVKGFDEENEGDNRQQEHAVLEPSNQPPTALGSRAIYGPSIDELELSSMAALPTSSMTESPPFHTEEMEPSSAAPLQASHTLQSADHMEASPLAAPTINHGAESEVHLASSVPWGSEIP